MFQKVIGQARGEESNESNRMNQSNEFPAPRLIFFGDDFSAFRPTHTWSVSWLSSILFRRRTPQPQPCPSPPHNQHHEVLQPSCLSSGIGILNRSRQRRPPRRAPSSIHPHLTATDLTRGRACPILASGANAPPYPPRATPRSRRIVSPAASLRARDPRLMVIRTMMTIVV